MNILIKILIILVLFVVYVRFLEHTSIFFPSNIIMASPKDIGLDFEDIFFETQDHLKINGWLVKHPQGKSTLLFFHGNAGNNGDRLDKIALFYKLGLNVFIVEYRGYGASQGKPSERGMYLDALGAYDYLMTRDDIDAKKIIAYGESLGGAAAAELATTRKLSGLILDSTITSAAGIARLKMPFIPTFLIKTKLDTLSKISRIDAPKLIIHSRDDEMIPFKMGQQLFEAAGEPKVFLEMRGTHNEGFFEHNDIFAEGIGNFLNQLENGRLN